MYRKNGLLAGAALMMAAFSFNEAQATSCAVPPTCAQLGYTMKKADCGEMPIMRCPFALTDDNQVYCEGTVKLAALPILYGDGTVSKKIISGKTPIGVVFDEANRLAVALIEMVKLDWSNNEYDIPSLVNCTDSNTVISCEVNGRANTDKILACGSGCGGTPAAEACNNYEPTGCTADFCKKTKWFLPSMRDLNNIYKVKNLMNASLTSLGALGAEVLSGVYFSSNEASDNKVWKINELGTLYNDRKKEYGTRTIRPVVEF